MTRGDSSFFFCLRLNFVTAFHFHYKAAKLCNAGLIFRHFIDVALQEYKNISMSLATGGSKRRPGLAWRSPRGNRGMDSTTVKFSVCPLQAAAFIVGSPGQKWSTVPFTRALKYYIPLGDISIVAWPSSLKREPYGMGEELGHNVGGAARFGRELAVTRWCNLRWTRPGRSCSCAVS